jgi:hypothetical protein
MLIRTTSDYLASKIHTAIIDILRQSEIGVSREVAGNAIALGSQGALHDIFGAAGGEQGDPAQAPPRAEADQAGSASQ